MSKKILSLALVVVMLFSMFAITSGAELASGQVGLRLETNATVGTPAGSNVWVKFYIEVPEAMNFAYNNITIAWNSEAYTPDCTNQTKVNDAIVMGDSYADLLKGTSAATHTTTAGANAIKNLTAEEQSYGWNKAVQFQLTAPGGNYTSTTGFPVEPGFSEVLTMNFVTNRELTAADVIGFPMSAYNSTQLKLQTMERNNTASKTLVATDNLVVTNAAPAAPTKADVYKLADPRKHADGDKYTVAAFFAFDAATIAPNFNTAGTSQFITGITATITATSGGQTITVTPDAIKYVYDINDDGTVYGFRVIMKNVPADAVITVVPAVATTNNATYTVDTLNITVANVTAY